MCIFIETLGVIQGGNIQNEDFMILDTCGDNCATCMHYTDIEHKVVPKASAEIN